MWKPVLIMFVAMSFIPTGDTAGKLLTTQHDAAPIYVAWSRFVVGTLLVLPFVDRKSWLALRDPRIVFRGLLLAAGISSILTGLRTAPLADVFAAFFVGPSISYILAVIFLREPLSALRALLVAVGFAGMLITVRPGAGMDPGLAWAVLAGCLYGAFLTASRWLSPVARPKDLLFSQLVVAMVVTTPFALTALPTFTFAIGALSVASGAASMLGNFLLLFAYRMAPATTLAPLVYFQLLAATALGWSVFGTLPDIWTWIGLGLILTSGVASALLAPSTRSTDRG